MERFGRKEFPFSFKKKKNMKKSQIVKIREIISN